MNTQTMVGKILTFLMNFPFSLTPSPPEDEDKDTKLRGDIEYSLAYWRAQLEYRRKDDEKDDEKDDDS